MLTFLLLSVIVYVAILERVFSMKTLNKVISTIEKYSMFSNGDTVVVGVSGGADSVMLLHCLYLLRDRYNLKIKVAHVNHKIRKGDAEKDAEFVRSLCEKFGVEFYLKEAYIKDLSKEWNMGEEETGRKVRYGFFRELAGKNGKIATAHNANDNAETVLMRFMRGTGVKGLSGIAYKSGQIVRPILGISRAEIEAYLVENGLTHITDSTNLVPIYTRNKIRLDLIPKIQKDFNPNFIETVNNTISSYRDDADYFEYEVSQKFNKLVKKNGTSYFCDKTAFFGLHPAISKRLIRKIVEEMKGKEQIDITPQKIESILNMNHKVGTVIMLNDGIVVKMGYSDLYFEYTNTSEKNMNVYDISLPELLVMNYTTLMDDNIDLSVFDVDDLRIDNKPNCFYLPYDIYSTKHLQVRTRRDGDMMRVEDGVHKKLSKFMVDKKIPSEIRDNLWLLCDGNEVLCIFDYFVTRFAKRNGRFIKVVKEN